MLPSPYYRKLAQKTSTWVNRESQVEIVPCTGKKSESPQSKEITCLKKKVFTRFKSNSLSAELQKQIKSNFATENTHKLEYSLTVALSKTLMEFSSATFLLRRTSSSVQRGSVSHFPKTTKSMSLAGKKRYHLGPHIRVLQIRATQTKTSQTIFSHNISVMSQTFYIIICIFYLFLPTGFGIIQSQKAIFQISSTWWIAADRWLCFPLVAKQRPTKQ